MGSPASLVGAVGHDPKVLAFWELLREHLATQKIAIDFALFNTYERLVDALLAGHVDAAFLDPLAHVRARRRSGGKLAGVAMRDIDRDVTSKVLVRRDAGVTALSDLHGKTLALGSADSVRARILPSFFLARAGVDLAKVDVATFEHDLGKHGDTWTSELAIAAALHEGRAHAGVIGAPVYTSLLASGKIDPRRVDILWTTPPFDHHVLEGLAAFEAKAAPLRRALLDLRWNNPKHRKLLELDGNKAWVAARDEGYATLETALPREPEA